VRLLLSVAGEVVAGRLARGLRREGHAVDVVTADVLWAAVEYDFDALVLGTGTPFPDGIAVVGELRARNVWTPVLLLATTIAEDGVRGLDAGADAFSGPPIVLTEVCARLRAITRRVRVERPVCLQVRDLALDPVTRTARRGEVEIPMRPKEFSLLHELMRYAGQPVTRRHIIDHVWDAEFDPRSNVVEVYVGMLRSKIDRPFGRKTIRTVRSVGYLLDPTG
jgi:two-component system OmpR family response regulator